MEEIKENEKELAQLLFNYNFERDNAIMVGLASRKFNLIDEVIEYLHKNPKCKFGDVMSFIRKNKINKE